jgi:hypothetical protein
MFGCDLVSVGPISHNSRLQTCRVTLVISDGTEVTVGERIFQANNTLTCCK